MCRAYLYIQANLILHDSHLFTYPLTTLFCNYAISYQIIESLLKSEGPWNAEQGQQRIGQGQRRTSLPHFFEYEGFGVRQ